MIGPANGELACAPRGTGATEVPQGLDAAGVRERVAAGKVNVGTARASRSLGQILRANLLTRFNAILGSLLVVVAIVGPPQDGLFGGVWTALGLVEAPALGN